MEFKLYYNIPGSSYCYYLLLYLSFAICTVHSKTGHKKGEWLCINVLHFFVHM